MNMRSKLHTWDKHRHIHVDWAKPLKCLKWKRSRLRSKRKKKETQNKYFKRRHSRQCFKSKINWQKQKLVSFFRRYLEAVVVICSYCTNPLDVVIFHPFWKNFIFLLCLVRLSIHSFIRCMLLYLWNFFVFHCDQKIGTSQ